MNRNDYIKLDFNLLKVFALLMQERNLTTTARRLSVGQPAVSHALARLRIEFSDPLFVRAGRVMEPTARAVTLYAEISPALDKIESALLSTTAFDPTTTERIFNIAMSDDLQMAFLPQIITQLSSIMPRAKLVVQQTNYIKATEMLDKKQVSMVIGYLSKLPASAKVRKIKRFGYEVLMGGTGMRITGLEEYCSRLHMVVTFAGDLVGYVDETLETMDASRSVFLSLSSFAIVPYILKDTSYIATVPKYLATSLAKQDGIGRADLPFRSPEFDVSIAWTAIADTDPAEKTVRDMIVATIKG